MAADPIFVSPHYDDIALSVGALVSLLAADSSPAIATVFAGAPSGSDFSGFAERMHAEWGLSGVEAVEARRAEDRCASRVLGESVRAVWMDWLDAIYRDHRYGSDIQLFDAPLATDAGLVSEIAAAIEQLGDGEIYIPLGVGNHVDHQIVFKAGKELASRSRVVFAYADLPYALVEGSLQRRLSSVGGPQHIEISVSPADVDRKWQAIQCYRSQVPFILRDISNPRSRFEEFMIASPGNGLVERLWIVESDT